MANELVHIVSHELRSPLTSLQAAVRMVQSELLGPLNADQKGALAITVSSFDRLGRLINNLLDVSKIEAGKLEINRQWTDLCGVATEVARNFEPLAKERGLQVRLNLPSTPVRLYVDRDKILQVFTNLIQNSLKFTVHGHVELIVRTPTGDAVCGVADTGPGITPENLPKLFGKFQQMGPSSIHKEKGTGLGLSITKGIVELHKGKIWAESKVGEGTQLLFTLPRVEAGEVFQEQVHRLFEQAVAASKPLTLFAIRLDPWAELQTRLGEEKAIALLDRLEEVVRAVSRRESDPLVKMPGHLWLVAPGVNKEDGQMILARVDQAVQDAAFQSAAPLPTSLVYRLASYPEDARIAQQLITLVHDIHSADTKIPEAH